MTNPERIRSSTDFADVLFFAVQLYQELPFYSLNRVELDKETGGSGRGLTSGL